MGEILLSKVPNITKRSSLFYLPIGFFSSPVQILMKKYNFFYQSNQINDFSVIVHSPIRLHFSDVGNEICARSCFKVHQPSQVINCYSPKCFLTVVILFGSQTTINKSAWPAESHRIKRNLKKKLKKTA